MQEFQRSPIKEIREIGIQVLEIHSKLVYLLKLKKQQQTQWEVLLLLFIKIYI